MSASAILSFSTTFALVTLSLGLLLTVARIVRGPTLPDRVLGLDMLVAIAIGFIAVIAIRSGFNLYIDIAIALEPRRLSGNRRLCALHSGARLVARMSAAAGWQAPKHGKAVATERRRKKEVRQ